MSKHVVATVGDMPPGSRKRVTIGDRAVLVFNIEGRFYGLHDRCPHQGGSLAHGTLCGRLEAPEPGVYHLSHEQRFVRCPWHGWQFDIATGQSWCEPDRLKTPTYAVEVEAGEDLVKGPYVAETVQVSVDGAYIVVDA